jgi:hypothetical protein
MVDIPARSKLHSLVADVDDPSQLLSRLVFVFDPVGHPSKYSSIVMASQNSPAALGLSQISPKISVKPCHGSPGRVLQHALVIHHPSALGAGASSHGILF